jgi:hypothetical protein
VAGLLSERHIEAECRRRGLPAPVIGCRLPCGARAHVFTELDAVVLIASGDAERDREAVNRLVLDEWRPVVVTADEWRDGRGLDLVCRLA